MWKEFGIWFSGFLLALTVVVASYSTYWTYKLYDSLHTNGFKESYCQGVKDGRVIPDEAKAAMEGSIKGYDSFGDSLHKCLTWMATEMVMEECE